MFTVYLKIVVAQNFIDWTYELKSIILEGKKQILKFHKSHSK